MIILPAKKYRTDGPRTWIETERSAFAAIRVVVVWNKRGRHGNKKRVEKKFTQIGAQTHPL
jgi:hypothetical protein